MRIGMVGRVLSCSFVAAGCALSAPPAGAERGALASGDNAGEDVTVCVVRSDGPAHLPARIVADGDTVVATAEGPVPWREHAGRSGGYAEGRGWFVRGDDIPLRPSDWPWPEAVRITEDSTYISRHRFIPNPRVPHGVLLTPDELRRQGTALVRVTEYDGVPVFAETKDVSRETSVPDNVYLPVRPGCLFQPYRPSIET